VIHQIGSTLFYGDAITNHIAALDHQLTSWGFETRIYAAKIEGARMAKAELDEAYTDVDWTDDVLIYHYSAYCENYRLFRRSRNRKILIYHNITPASFYSPYSGDMAAVCARGRDVLPLLSECDLALAVSEFNRQELVAAGFDPARTAVLPVLLSLENFKTKRRDEWVYRQLTAERRTNIISVGRGAPNKAYQDLIKLFAVYHQTINTHSRLHLVGSRFLPKYDEELEGLIMALKLEHAVTFTGRVSLQCSRRTTRRAMFSSAPVFTRVFVSRYWRR